MRDEFGISDWPIERASKWYFENVLAENVPDKLIDRLLIIRNVDTNYEG